MLKTTDDTTSRPAQETSAVRHSPQTTLADENFPVALRILPARTRRHLLALYEYARYVDDLGDEPHAGKDDDPSARLAELHQLDEQLRAWDADVPPTHPVLRRLAPTVAARQLPVEPLRRLVAANLRDQQVVRYASFDELLRYCELSANPVGELVLHIFGAAAPYRVVLSDRICTALQIVEHLQDVPEDRRRGRIYLPGEDLRRCGVSEYALDAPYANEALREVIGLQARRAADLLTAGTPLVRELTGWARLAVAGYVAGGRAALAALARSRYDPMAGPPRAGRARVAAAWFAVLLARP